MGEAPKSPDTSLTESFLADADGSGSIAEAIGRTLDVCVQEIEKAIADETEKVENMGATSSCSDNNGKTVEEGVAVGAADAFSVASSMLSSMTDVLKKIDAAKK